MQEFVYNPGETAPTWFTPAIQVRNGLMPLPTTPGLGIRYDDSVWKTAERVG
jgi:L-alanine-DL-glutamate epimerase-like enolase superfamily enzyme